MGMSESERVELGAKIRSQRERLYGTKRAAYTAADVNGATWDKAEAGESLRGDRLRLIVRTLWPETEGDWTLIDTEARQSVDPMSEMAARLSALEERIADFLRAQELPRQSGEESRRA